MAAKKKVAARRIVQPAQETQAPQAEEPAEPVQAPVRRASTETRRRRPKPPMTQDRFKLKVENKDPNKEYYWASDSEIPGLLDRDYSFSDDPNLKVGTDERGNQSQSSVIKRDGGGGKTLTLMEIPKEWWDQDREAEEQALKRHEQKIYQPDAGLYAKNINIKHGDNSE